jgi:cystathionine beta-lyase family protein involved in aluminum resistance
MAGKLKSVRSAARRGRFPGIGMGTGNALTMQGLNSVFWSVILGKPVILKIRKIQKELENLNINTCLEWVARATDLLPG